MAQGSENFIKTAGFYFLFSAIPVFLRCRIERSYIPVDLESPLPEKFQDEPSGRRAGGPYMSTAFLLVLGAMFLPHQPWRHLTSTLLYDVVGTISSVMLNQSIRDSADCSVPFNTTVLGAHPLGDSFYNPANDPYYISNLNLSVIPFIAEALKGTQFTHVVHIVLESMRADCYPFREDGLLNQHIRTKLVPTGNEAPITTETITPFISSLAENLISWDTVWATIPFTHKSMLGCTVPCLYKIDVRLLRTITVAGGFYSRTRWQGEDVSNLLSPGLRPHQFNNQSRGRKAGFIKWQWI
jgi:hypothetical protein